MKNILLLLLLLPLVNGCVSMEERNREAQEHIDQICSEPVQGLDYIYAKYGSVYNCIVFQTNLYNENRAYEQRRRQGIANAFSQGFQNMSNSYNNNINCTSHSYGNTTHTNCY